MNIEINALEIEGAYEIKNSPFMDQRGSFLNLIKYQDTNFRKIWGSRSIKQINLSFTKQKGTIRGMHLQKEPFREAKLITCIKGQIWDVCVDLRRNSSSYGKWFQITLSAELKNSLFIPEGFAHGFQPLEDNVEMIYIHSEEWSKSHEAGLNCRDMELKIPWPLHHYNLSEKDKNLPNLKFYA